VIKVRGNQKGKKGKGNDIRDIGGGKKGRRRVKQR
jgi:hypothetical protein